MPDWLRSQLRRAFLNHDVKAVAMLNQAYFRYRSVKSAQM
ncbi:cortex morphogenetic protein CmpA [Alicyclobacillus sp. SO9]|nr:cortex morphogenetic protein CmpA [Alicyclobacillus sp. SO9]QQE79421.1 cortex morphogenetic protein CmpA [Alicyclobacillus sp. SO9]